MQIFIFLQTFLNRIFFSLMASLCLQTNSHLQAIAPAPSDLHLNNKGTNATLHPLDHTLGMLLSSHSSLAHTAPSVVYHGLLFLCSFQLHSFILHIPFNFLRLRISLHMLQTFFLHRLKKKKMNCLIQDKNKGFIHTHRFF